MAQLGPENATALETTFGVFYRLGLSLSTLLRESTLLASDSSIRSEVGQVLNILLILVREVSVVYSLKLSSTAEKTSFDFNGAFGPLVAAFHKSRNHIIEALWELSLGKEAALEIRNIRKWLGGYDASLQKLLKAEESASGVLLGLVRVYWQVG